MNVPDDLRYNSSHEWIRLEGGIATVGISDHAQEELTDVVFVELPEVGKAVDAGDPTAVVESVKAASDIYAPIAGEVVEANDAVEADPSLVNTDPYGAGWIFKLKVKDEAQVASLMDAAAYSAQIGG
jgi:glycine cleavage system H protein